MSSSMRRRVERLEGPEPALLFDLAAQMRRAREDLLSLTLEEIAAQQIQELEREREQHARGELDEFGIRMLRGLERVLAGSGLAPAHAVQA
jgi:hypothetical protein